MPEKANISRTLILPLMSIILLVSVYMTANVLLPLKADGKGNGKDDYVSDNQHLSDDAGSGEAVEMNINFSEKCIVIDSGHGGADPGKVGVSGTKEKEINLAIAKKLQERLEDAQINVIMTRDTDDDLSVESDKSKKKADLDRRFKETGVENVYLPCLIPDMSHLRQRELRYSIIRSPMKARKSPR